MANHKDHQTSRTQDDEHIDAETWRDPGSDFVLVQEAQPPRRIKLARERMLMCRLYLGLIRSLNDDYGEVHDP
jgi:hypothetical protein